MYSPRVIGGGALVLALVVEHAAIASTSQRTPAFYL